MRILIQRVSQASVKVQGNVVANIGSGLLAFVGFRESDTDEILESQAVKLVQLRIFCDSEGKMNRSVEDIGGSVLIVSQFTLYGDAKKGNRPNFMAAAGAEDASRLYDRFVELVRSKIGEERIGTGVFQATMEVALVNDGPVTILLEKESDA